MHGMGVHSALALKRQRNRQRRDQGGDNQRRRSSVGSMYKPAMPQKVKKKLIAVSNLSGKCLARVWVGSGRKTVKTNESMRKLCHYKL